MKKMLLMVVLMTALCFGLLFFSGFLTPEKTTKVVNATFEKTKNEEKERTPFVFEKNEGGVSFGVVDFSTAKTNE